MKEKVSTGEAVLELWSDLSGAQKFVTIALAVLAVVLVVGSWINTFQAWSEIRVYENDAIKARQEKDEALEAARKIASNIKVREEALGKVEVKQNETKDEIKRGESDIARGRAEYERAVRERRPDVPSTDELCAELKQLGYPCYPIEHPTR